jgi:hypothetical protein
MISSHYYVALKIHCIEKGILLNHRMNFITFSSLSLEQMAFNMQQMNTRDQQEMQNHKQYILKFCEIQI